MSNTLNQLKEVFAGTPNEASIEQFLDIMELEDVKFDAIYPQLKESLENAFNTENFREEAIRSLKEHPIEDFEKEKETMNEFIQSIREDDSISENKKDLIITLLNQSVMSVYEVYQNPREKVDVKIVKINENAKIPEYAHDSDAGADVYAAETITIEAGQTAIVKTGLKIAIPLGYEVQIRPRSGFSLKTPMRVANAPGTIDAKYRGEVGVLMHNTGTEAFTINTGDRIAQMVIAPTPMIRWNEVETLDETDRGEGGFGSTGV